MSFSVGKEAEDSLVGASDGFEGIIPVIEMAASLEKELGPQIQQLLDVVSVVLRKATPRAPFYASLLNVAPRLHQWAGEPREQPSVHTFHYRPPLYRLRTPDGVLQCNMMNASVPGSCANVKGTPYRGGRRPTPVRSDQGGKRMTRRLRPAAVAAVCALTVSSCASINVNSLPQPGASYDDGYDVVMQFDSVLNLPERAKVVLDGVTVGVVSKMTLTTEDVDVTARVRNGVVIPSDIHAVLQQPTVLGDIYVALERPPAGVTPAPPLAPGAAIPVSQTTSPPQLEDTIASLANFVSSGSIQRVQNTIIRLNRVVPSSDEVRTLTTRVETNLAALSAEHRPGRSIARRSVADRGGRERPHPAAELLVLAYGQRGFEHLIGVSNYISTILPASAASRCGGYWLVPLLNSLADSVGALQQSKVAGEAEIPKYRQLFTNVFLPVDKYPAINITSIVGPDGRELSGNVQEVLRILGATP